MNARFSAIAEPKGGATLLIEEPRPKRKRGGPSQFSSWLKAPLRWALKSSLLRRRLAFELKREHYRDLKISVPLGYKLSCPVCTPSAWLSFSQIFFQSEYSAAFKHIPPPNRWMDLGCHVGYFSLYVTWLRAAQGTKSDFAALLVDGDSRVREAVECLIKSNDLDAHLRFERGIVSATQAPQYFSERENMDSAIGSKPWPEERLRKVEILSAEQLMRFLPPPYDLIKMDIEGAEYDFLSAYQPVLEHTQHLLFEWHSWHSGGGGRQQIESLARSNGFELAATLVEDSVLLRAHGPGTCGVLLYRKIRK